MKPHHPLASIASALTRPVTPIKDVFTRSRKTSKSIDHRGPPPPTTTQGRVKVQDPSVHAHFEPARKKDWSFDHAEYAKEVRRNQPKKPKTARAVSAKTQALIDRAMELLKEL